MSTEPKKNNVLSLLLRVGLSAGLLWFIFSKIDLKKTAEVLKSADIQSLVFAFITFIVINLLILWRWTTLIRAVELKTPLLTISRFLFVGLFGNLFLPSAVGGDIIKIAGLCKDNAHKAKVVASVVLDRMSGFAAIVIVGTIAFILGNHLINDNSLVMPIIVMAVFSSLLAVFLFNEKVYSVGMSIFNVFPKVKEACMKMHYDIALLKKHPLMGMKAIAISCLCQLMFAYTFYLTALALHQDVKLAYFFIFVPLICVAASLPSIGGLGVREAGAAYLFAKAGVAAEVAVSMSLINFLFMVAIGLFGGLFFILTSSRK